MLRLTRDVLRELDRRLGREHGLAVTEFDVLITLDNADERRLRMSDLAEAAMLSSGGLTRLVGRLEDRGFLRRQPDVDDGRIFPAQLTAAGARALRRARVTHDAVIEELVASRTTQEDLRHVASILAQATQR
jgi:DNA-binding MarR family transcriptional regulator